MKIVRSNTIDPSSLASEENNEYSFFKSRAKFHSNEVPPFGVYIDQKAWAAFLEHGHQVYAQQRHEAQGIFLGKYFTDEQGEFVVATHYAAGKGESTHSYVEMSEECLAQISQKCKEENLLMLIWIHTHPNFGVFYSGTDINCLKTNFFMPYQTGIVVDIIRKLHKGFKVREKNVTEFENYFVFDREAPELLKPYQTTKSVTPELTAKKKDHDQSASQSGTPNYEALEDIQAGIENLTRAFKTERLQRNNDTVEHQMSAHTEIISSQITSLKAEINNSIRHKEVSRQVIPIIRYQWITLVLQILTLVLLLILLVLNFYSFAERS